MQEPLTTPDHDLLGGLHSHVTGTGILLGGGHAQLGEIYPETGGTGVRLCNVIRKIENDAQGAGL